MASTKGGPTSTRVTRASLALNASDPRPTIQWLSDADSYSVLTTLLLEPGSPQELCQRIVDLAGKDKRVATCSIFLTDQTGENLYLAASNNPALNPYLSKQTYRMGEGITGWVAKYRQAVLVRDPSDPEECGRLGDPENDIPSPKPGGVPFSEGAHDGWLAAPITDIEGRKCIGVIRVQPRVSWLELTQTDVSRLQVVARLTYLVTQNAKLRERQMEEAEEDALQTLTAKVAHRVGNRLYAMANLVQALELALKGGPGEAPGPSLHLLNQMRGTVESTRELVRNLVKQTSLPPLSLRPVSLTELLKTIAGCCVPCEMTPEVTIAPGSEMLVCDPDQLRTALGEIIENSAEIVGRCARIRIAASVTRGWTRIEIADDGPGVPPEMKRKIFEPMFTTRAGGTGWGLVIAREVVEKHGGTITEEGVPGEGARFVICLPKGKPDVVSPAGRRR